MFINFWYPVSTSDALTAGAPLHSRVLGQDLVLFRDDQGTAHCLHNVCVHRGGNLAGGKVKGDAVECPYHGWRFNGAGVCTRIPSAGPDAKIPARARVDAYPVVERYGIVFAFLGDLPEAERPPIMEIPEWGDPAWRFNLVTYTWSVNYERAIENTLDPSHTEFVHPGMGFGGENENFRVPRFDPIIEDWGVGVMTTFYTPGMTDETLKQLKDKPAETTAGAGNHGPASTWTRINISPVAATYQYAFGAPVDAHTYKRYFLQGRNFMTDPALDARVMGRNDAVMEQDRVVIEKLEPAFTPTSALEEVIVEADSIIVRYRALLKDWQQRGWRIDQEAIERDYRHKRVWAIPSPARRTQKGWAFAPVPLLGAAAPPPDPI